MMFPALAANKLGAGKLPGRPGLRIGEGIMERRRILRIVLVEGATGKRNCSPSWLSDRPACHPLRRNAYGSVGDILSKALARNLPSLRIKEFGAAMKSSSLTPPHRLYSMLGLLPHAKDEEIPDAYNSIGGQGALRPRAGDRKVSVFGRTRLMAAGKPRPSALLFAATGSTRLLPKQDHAGEGPA
jgi:hypothetical protein